MSGTDDRDQRASYRIADDPDQVAEEAARLRTLAAARDGLTTARLGRLGVGLGWHCLDLGTGAGTIAQWLAERVGPTGHVLATDVDTRFAPESAANLEVRQHDIVNEPLPPGTFDLIHARAVLQHLAQREAVLDKLVAALRPGGVVVVHDGDWIQWDAQEIPEPFATFAGALRSLSEAQFGFDTTWGRRLLPALRERGLVDVDCEGHVSTMHGGTDSAEWYVAGLARAAPRVVAAGIIDADLAAAAIAQARDPDFMILGPISLIASGRRPA